ncbi:MAG: CocE/NonD family hydrolase [Bacteroidales bacterium]|nr:CocE/NonD family hydrolase [Bacteroidales bacterium]
MRDGVKLFTTVYTPKDSLIEYPVMMIRTPYGVKPYGTDTFPVLLGPSKYLMEEKYIFIYQDVRGKFMSEGDFDNMTPHVADKKTGQEIDQGTDTYDAVEWILKNVRHHNGKVGLWGISYPGFYVSSGIIDTHPAVKCASPQAPIADWFAGDDMHHNGAFSLMMSYNFFELFGIVPGKPYRDYDPLVNYPVKDAYNFFLELGPLNKVNSHYFNNRVPFWDTLVKHDTYDPFWRKRNILPHLKNISAAVLTTGGWFDGEDLFGTLHTYKYIEEQNPGLYNILVMGPWIHGGWARTKGDSLGLISFNSQTSDFYQKEVELKFFNHFLKNKGDLNLPEALVFETGSNTWKEYDKWPPANARYETLYLHENHLLKFSIPEKTGFLFDEYTNDPENPVPYTSVFHNSRVFYNKEYLVEDQRFASVRPDVLCYQTEVLDQDITVAGPLQADLYVSTTVGDADWVVKIIDVFPDTLNILRPKNAYTEMAGYQMLVRGEILRGKFRNSLEKPTPFMSGKVEQISIKLQDINHTFKKGHRIMLQVQGSWFPLYDRNPQKYMNIFEAGENDFQKALQRVYHSANYPSCLIFRVVR